MLSDKQKFLYQFDFKNNFIYNRMQPNTVFVYHNSLIFSLPDQVQLFICYSVSTGSL